MLFFSLTCYLPPAAVELTEFSDIGFGLAVMLPTQHGSMMMRNSKKMTKAAYIRIQHLQSCCQGTNRENILDFISSKYDKRGSFGLLQCSELMKRRLMENFRLQRSANVGSQGVRVPGANFHQHSTLIMQKSMLYLASFSYYSSSDWPKSGPY